MIPFYRPSMRFGAYSWGDEKVLTLNNFGGGLNNVEPETVIGDNECADTMNMRFVNNTLMEKRFGTNYVDVDEYVKLPSAVTFVDKYYPLDDDPVFIRATDSEFYVGNEKICDVNGTVRGVNYIGKYYFVDGTNLYVYDGETYYVVVKEPFGYLSQDIAANDTVIYIEDIPSQTKVGDKVFFLSSIISWQPNDTADHILKTITAIDRDNGTVTLDTNINKNVRSIIDTKKSPIYFYEPNSESEYIVGETIYDKDEHWASYYPCALELATPFYGSSYLPDSPTIIVTHANRLFVSGDSETPNGVFISGYTAIAPQPLYFPSGSMISVKPNGQAVVDLVVFDNALIIGRHEDMFVLYGSSVVPGSDNLFYLKQMDVSSGFMSGDCGALLNNFYIYLGYDGLFYKLNTPTTFVEYLMTRPLSLKCDVYSEPFNIERGSKIRTSSVAYRNEVFININDDLTIIYNFNNMGHTYYTGWKSSSLYTDAKTMYIGTSNGDLVKYLDADESSYVDLGEPIISILKTKRFDFGQSANYKYFKRYMVTTQNYDNLSGFDMNVDIDYFKTFPSSFNSSKTMFGTAVFGDIFNNREVTKSSYVDLDYRGRSIQFTLINDDIYKDLDENVYGKPFRLYDINLLYSIRDVR